MSHFILADLPGLIEGTSDVGIGLSDRFLRHMKRCRVIIYIL